jgi:uracil-DNA glycosylase
MSILEGLKGNYPVGWEKFFEDNYHLLEHIDEVIAKKGGAFYPEAEKVFEAYRLCQPEKIKVILLGMDPYFDGSANGLAFSVSKDVAIPPSLRNIFKLIKTTKGRDSICAKDGDLTPWANQGVLLLNAS